MRRKSYNIPAHAHFLTFSCYRRCQILASDENCALVAECIAASRERIGFDLWAYVFMRDHVHLLIRPRGQTYSMAVILKSIKGPFAKRFMAIQIQRNTRWVGRLSVRTSAGISHRVWQRGGGFDRNLITPDLILRAATYIEHNPPGARSE